MGNELNWLIGALIVAVLVITVIIPTTVTLTSSFTAPGTATAELWTGTAATAHLMANTPPIASVTTFKKAASYSQYNDTKINVGNSTGNTHLHILVDSFAAHSSATWDNLTVVFTLQGINATNNVTWTVGDCNAANKTWITSPQTYSDIDSTCLTPGSPLTFSFVNKTAVEGADLTGTNVTNVTITYQRYLDNTAYTLDSAAGKITPTLTGYYYTSYTYGTGVTGSTLALVVLLPLLIAVVFFMIFMKSSGMF
jgi:hypothetical protein